MLRAARRRIESRSHQGRLIQGLRTVAAAEDEVFLTKNNVHGSLEFRGRSNDQAKRKELAKGLGLFVCYLDSENWL